MKKIVALLMLCVSFMFAAINLQTATKEELMSIKGIGDKKADSIIEYRKTNEIKDPEDLKNIKRPLHSKSYINIPINSLKQALLQHYLGKITTIYKVEIWHLKIQTIHFQT